MSDFATSKNADCRHCEPSVGRRGNLSKADSTKTTESAPSRHCEPSVGRRGNLSNHHREPREACRIANQSSLRDPTQWGVAIYFQNPSKSRHCERVAQATSVAINSVELR